MESETASLLQPAVEVVKKYEGGKAKDIFLTVSYCFAGVRSSSMLGLFYASSMYVNDDLPLKAGTPRLKPFDLFQAKTYLSII